MGICELHWFVKLKQQERFPSAPGWWRPRHQSVFTRKEQASTSEPCKKQSFNNFTALARPKPKITFLAILGTRCI